IGDSGIRSALPARRERRRGHTRASNRVRILPAHARRKHYRRQPTVQFFSCFPGCPRMATPAGRSSTLAAGSLLARAAAVLRLLADRAFDIGDRFELLLCFVERLAELAVLRFDGGDALLNGRFFAALGA